MSRLVPKLRFKEFSGEWKQKKLGDVGNLISGLTYSPDDVRDKGLLVLRSSNVQNSKITLDDNVYVKSNIKGVNISKTNDILICVRNGSKNLIGKNTLIPNNMPLCTHGAFMMVFRSEISQFIYQLFQTNIYFKQVEADLGATINSINVNLLKKYFFYIPIPKEQQKIASCLSSLDALIEAQNKKVSALKQHKKGLMQQLFPAEGEREPKLRFKAFSGEWVEKKLGDVAIKKSSNILANTLVNNKGKYSIYGASGYLQNIDFYNEDDPYIAIIKDGSGVGKSFLCVEKSSIIGTLQVIKPLNKDNLAFLYFLINKIDFSKYISGGAIPHIYFKDYSKEIIKIPSPPEQQKIANTLSTLDNLIEAQNQKIAQLKQHKKALMQQMFVSNEVGA